MNAAIRCIQHDLKLNGSDVTLPILETRAEAEGALLVRVSISPAVFAWVRVDANGQAERINDDLPPEATAR